MAKHGQGGTWMTLGKSGKMDPGVVEGASRKRRGSCCQGLRGSLDHLEAMTLYHQTLWLLWQFYSATNYIKEVNFWSPFETHVGADCTWGIPPPRILFSARILDFISVFYYCVCLYEHMSHVCGNHGGQKRASELLGLPKSWANSPSPKQGFWSCLVKYFTPMREKQQKSESLIRSTKTLKLFDHI